MYVRFIRLWMTGLSLSRYQISTGTMMELSGFFRLPKMGYCPVSGEDNWKIQEFTVDEKKIDN